MSVCIEVHLVSHVESDRKEVDIILFGLQVCYQLKNVKQTVWLMVKNIKYRIKCFGKIRG